MVMQLRNARQSVNTKTLAELGPQALEFHPLANLFPLMMGNEFAELVADIKANGLREKITLYEGKILDGRNRYRACRETDVKVETDDFEGDETSARAFVISKNFHRRHLTAEQKREVIAKLIKAHPSKSHRQIAEMVKASHHTVASVRADLERRGQVAHVSTRTDSKGRKQPAHRTISASSKIKFTPERITQ